MRRVPLLAMLALAACTTPAAPPPTTTAAAAAVCRVGPDGARPVADRGIGGTGAPAVQSADRGIGGTGIIGVVTGFASICVAGEEVALPSGLPPSIDGQPGSLDDLRAGQVVALRAAGLETTLLAREIVIRHAVIGPVQSARDGTLVVAGQQVLVGDASGSATHAVPGQSVAISGFRQPGGAIVATRVDPAPAGPVLLRGELTRIYGVARVGAQAIRLPEGSTAPGGFPVVVTGTMQGEVLVADSVARDLADESPAAYFGPAVSNYVVEGYLAVTAGGFFVSRDFIRGDGFRGAPGGRGIATFSRRPEGGLVARGQVGHGPFTGGDRGFAPAPMAPAGGGAFGPDRQGFSPRLPQPGFSGGGGAMPAGPQGAPPRR